MNITRSFSTLGYQRGNTQSGDSNSIGGAVGINGCSPTELFFTGSDNSGANGCGTSKTLVELYDSSTYASGSWSGNISFTDLTSTWVHLSTEDDNDHPRLSWELKPNPSTGIVVEDEVPYLQRPCTNNYASMLGTGAIESPYQVCTVAQFLAMAPSTYYTLVRDIDLTDQPIGTSSLFSVGEYHLDGNNKSIFNHKIGQVNGSGFLGLFEGLAAGSIIEDLFIANLDVIVSGTPSAALNIGLLAGSNYGTISNVEIEGASLTFSNTYSHPAGFSVSAAGLTPFNGATGIIEDTEVNADIRIDDTNLTNVNGTDTFNVSGFVVQNDNLISSSVISGYLELQSSSANADSRDGLLLSSINNINNGKIEKMHSRMSIGVNNSALSNIYTTLGFGTNNGSISDIMLEGNFNFNNVSGSSSNYLMFGDNTSGNDIERLIASNSYSDHTMGGAPALTYGTDSGTTSDLFCIEYTANFFTTPLACYLQSTAPTFTTTKAMALYSPATLVGNTGARAIAYGDLNGDGYDDIAVANGTDFTVSVFYYNSGSDTFSAPVDTGLTGPNKEAVDLKIVDLDGDGDQDIIVGSVESGNPNILWLQNTDGAGTISVSSLASLTGAMKKLDVADYNGDGDQDIVVLMTAGLRLLDNNGSEVFTDSGINTPSDGTDLVTGDFNNDGLPDLVISENAADIVKFLPNSTITTASPATFGTFSNSSTGGALGAGEIDFGDIDEDGNLDLAVVLTGVTESMIMYGDGAGAFTPGYRFSGADDIKIRDTNGDSYLDVLIVNSTTGEVSAIKGSGTPYFEQESVYNCTGCTAVEAVDLNGDGYPEVLGVDPAGNIRHFENQGFVTENLVSTSDDVAATSWDIHQFTETSLDAPYSINADWHIYDGELEPGWSEGPDGFFEAGIFP